MNNNIQNVSITGIGMYVPEKTLDNAHFESYLDTSDEWITKRTGVKTRHIVEKGTPNSDLSYEAAVKALEMSGVAPEELDLIIVATVTPDRLFPSTACTLQAKLGAGDCGAFDVLAACSGFIYALSIAHGQMALGNVKKVLVVGSEVMSSIIDYNDRGICVLFGDGAGAVVLENVPEDRGSLVDYIIRADGRQGEILYMPAGGSLNPTSFETVKKNMHTVKMEGNKVFKLAIKYMAELAREITQRNGLTLDDIDMVCIHQANIRIVKGVMSALHLDMATKSYNNIDRYGNTTAASIPLCVHDAFKDNRLKKGDKMIILTFGAGLTYAAALMEWGIENTLQDSTAIADTKEAIEEQKITVPAGVNGKKNISMDI